MNARSVTLQTRVTEIESPLPGSRAWVAQQIETGELRITKTRKGLPAIFLVAAPDRDGKRQMQILADFGDPAYSGWNHGICRKQFDCWPFWDEGVDGGLAGWFDVTLTSAGRALALQFARKAKTLLRLAMRRQDRKPEGRFRVKIERE